MHATLFQAPRPEIDLMRSPYIAATALIPIYLATSVLGGVKEIWWNITYVEGANPDGLFERRVVGVNNTWPPPPVEVESTGRLVLHVTNSLDQPTTLHHHGMFFTQNSWMDGSQRVSQCGIPPGGNFTYVVPIDTDGQWGTYWIHAHSSGQYVDGLRTPLIIHPPKALYEYDEEFTIVIAEWYHTEHDILIKQYLSPNNPNGLVPMPDSALIYFIKDGVHLPPKPGTTLHSATSAVGFNENATLPFQPGKTYRLRIVNIGAFNSLFFWIDGHELRIIEADGTDVEETPLVGQVLHLAAAQRYSFLVTARNDTSANWGIHLNIDTIQFGPQPTLPSLNPNITATLTYNISVPRTDLSIDNFQDIDDTALVPIPAEKPPCVTRTICLELTFGLMTDGTYRAMFNGITHNFPLVPTMFSELTLGENATDPNAYGPLSFVLNYGEVVDLVVKNGDTRGGHPFHLHGHKFWIVGSTTNYTSDDPKLNPPLVEGQENPMRRDTVVIQPHHSATLRFVANNPGAWLFHCHIEWHFEVGFAVQFIEAPLEAQKHSHNFPPILNDHCSQLGLPYSGNAAGHSSTSDLSGLPSGPYPQQVVINSPCNGPVYS